MRKIFNLGLLLLLCFYVHSQGKNHQNLEQQVQSINQQETVVEANHFSSMTQISTSYTINQIVKDKSILFYLKPQLALNNDKTLEQNPITVSIKDGLKFKQCLFQTYTQLCVIPKASSQKIDLKIECKTTPCQLSWVIVQPPFIEEDGQHQLDHLVSINKLKGHASLKVSCSNIQLRQEMQKDLILYSNSKYEKIVAKDGISLIYFLFDNFQQGFYFLKTSNQKVKSCANASLIHMSDQISFNNENSQFLDYIKPNKLVSYPFTNLPQYDFRIQALAYDLTMQVLDSSTSIKLCLVGFTSQNRSVLSQMILSVDNQKTFIQFSAVFKKPHQKYDKLQFQIQVFGRMLMLRAHFVSAEVHQIELGQLSFFDLKKGEKIQYSLVPLNNLVKKIDKMHIFSSDTNKFKASQSTCPPQSCKFTLQALYNGQGNIYIGEAEKRHINQMIIKPFQNQISAKISFGEILYYSFDAKANEAIQILINVPGVVVYAATKQKCPIINQKCYETSLNHHFPAIYQPKNDNSLIFKAIGLDSCQFTLRVIDGKTPFIQIKDTQPFTYLFDDKESYLIFQFQMKQNQDVSFNLIGPVNQLNLFVLNQQALSKDQNKDWSAAQLSSDGFIKFNKDQIKALSFAIKVEKRSQFNNKFIHFTLIASTKESNLRLQPGAAHYETLKPKNTRDYVFEFQTKRQIMLNFYTHNIHRKEVKLGVHVSNADQYSDSENTASFTIDRNVDVLDISLTSKKLCKMNEGQNCELFVRVQNQMEVEADVTITLLVQDSIIELKDGIWQSYRVNGPSTSSHFYFLPRHQNHSATIFYKPSVVDLRILYNVWRSDDLSINLRQWPFPVDLQKPTDRFNFKPLQYIHIEPAKLKDCWPNCVILMSMITNSKDFQEAVNKDSSLLDAHFRIMASNNYIELPQKHKVDILISKNQSKELLVDLKYYLEKEQLTFLTHYTLGKSVIKANVYSETYPRCPVSDGDSDFTLDAVQTILQIEEIKKKLQENSMQNEKNLYLCLIAYSEEDTKFNIEFNSNTNGFKKLAVDTTTTLKASAKEYLYYLDYSQETYIKMTRNEGFPFYKVKMCKPEQESDKCFDQFLQDKEQGTQLANKVTTIVQTPCPKCLLLLKVQFKQQTEIVLHTQSKFTQLQLAANSLVSDCLQPNEQNRYTLTGTQNQEIIINLQVTSGNVKVGVKDFQKIDIVKVNQKSSNNIHITVPPKDMSLLQKQLGQTHMSSFGLSTFVHLHITVESQDHSKPASYTITYSSGSPVVNLQDGLITEYNLIPKVQTKFIYKNPSDYPIYLYTSTNSAQSLQKLKLKYYGLQNMEDQDQKIEITPQKSQFTKKTLNPTNLVKLLSKKAYFFTVTNQNDKNILFTIGVNNRQIIYLPFDHEFPIELSPAQYIYLVINTVGEGYVKLSFSKCSISHPTISYTMNYDQFINQDYSIEDQMTEDLVSQIVLKVKSFSGIYIKVKSSDSQRTLMSIKALFSPLRIKGSRSKAGDKGLIQYQLLDSTKAEMTFSTVVCSKEQSGCGKGFNFFALTSDKIQNIYSQLVCPSIMFNLPQIQQLKSPKITSIAKGVGDQITFTQQISNDIEYVGVRAVNQMTGEIVYYHPVEIVTFWGQLHRSSQTMIVLAIFLVGLFGCGCLMVYRRYEKNQYKPVGQMNDVIDQD